MLEIGALQEAEQWTGPSIVAAVLIGAALIGLLAYLIYRYLQD